MGQVLFNNSSNLLKIGRTAFVDDIYGNDTTAVIERPDKPFRTFISAFQAVRSQLNPTATNRALIKAFRGTYDGPVYCNLGIDYDLGSSIISNTVLRRCIEVWDVNADSNIYGNAILLSPLVSASTILEASKACNINVRVNKIVGLSNDAVQVYQNSTLYLECESISDNNEPVRTFNFGTIKIKCNTITSANTTAVYGIGAGTIDLDCRNIISSAAVGGVITTDGTAEITLHDCLVKNNAAGFGILINSLTSKVIGDRVRIVTNPASRCISGTGTYVSYNTVYNGAGPPGAITVQVGSAINFGFLQDVNVV